MRSDPFRRHLALAIILILVSGSGCQSKPTGTAIPESGEHSGVVTPVATAPPALLLAETPRPTESAASATATVAQIPTVRPSVTPLVMRTHGAVPAFAINYPLPFGVRGDTGYAIIDDTVVALNLSYPIEPDIVWQSDNLGGPVGDAILVDSLALVRAGEELLFWDVAEPGLPVLAGRVAAPAGTRLATAGDRLYLYGRSAENLEITTVALTDLLDESARVTTTIPWENPFTYSIAFSQDRLALAQPSGITIYDLADPAAARLLATPDLAVNSDTTVQLQDNLLFVGTGYDLIIYELGPAGELNQLGRIAERSFTHMLLARDTAYLFTQICGWEENEEGEVKGGCGYGIQVVDISDSHNPTSKGYLMVETDDNQHRFGSVLLFGRYLYLGTDVKPGEERQFYLVDLAAPAD
ncbi:MAG: hypothetical protein KDE59_08175 [Anaerolineales bacterium]|nr:hypothetical protein [Anaerolineales bacterium]